MSLRKGIYQKRIFYWVSSWGYSVLYVKDQSQILETHPLTLGVTKGRGRDSLRNSTWCTFRLIKSRLLTEEESERVQIVLTVNTSHLIPSFTPAVSSFALAA
jgi:hypothetical protein